MIKLTILFTIILFLLITPEAFAENEVKIENRSGNSSVRVNINETATYRSESHTSINNDIRVNANSSNGEGEDVSLNVQNSEFKIEGRLNSVSGNNINVSGQEVSLDPSQVSEFKQKGVLGVGKRVKVEGEVRKGVMFAKEINVQSSPTITPKAEPSLNPSPSLSPSPSASPKKEVTIKIIGPIDQMMNLLRQLLSLFK